MSDFTVDVVIPTFNRRGTLERAVQSALGQSLKPASVIVVDDGSTDGTPSHFNLPGVIVHQQPNAGVGRARNVGVRLGTAEWVAFLDSDDWWDEDFLSDLADARAQCPDADVLYCRARNVDPNGRPLPGILGSAPGRDPLRRLLAVETLATPSSTAIRRTLFNGLGGFCEAREVGPSADWVLWTRAAVRAKFGYSPRIRANHMTHEGNMMSDPKRMSVAMLAAADLIWEDPIIRQMSGMHRMVTDARLSLLRGINEYVFGDMTASRRQLFAAVRKHPLLILRDPMFHWTLARGLLGTSMTRRLRSFKVRTRTSQD